MVHERARVHSDEGGSGQIKEEGDGEFEYAARAVGAQNILKASWHLAGGRTHIDIDGLASKSRRGGEGGSHALRGVQEGLVVWVSR